MSSPELLKSFFTHLDELRSRIVKSLGAFILAAVVCFYYAKDMLSWVTASAGHLMFTSPGGAFSAVMNVTITMAVILASPVILYQVWAFVATALRPQERRLVFIFGPLSLVLFCAGVLFAFFVAVPLAYKFLMSFASEDLVPMVSVDNYLSFLASLIIAFGVTFELPLVLGFLAMLGIATPEFLRQKRRHAIILILIVAAVCTPPDVASQVLLAVPLLFLYEAGIVCARLMQKKPHKTQDPLKI